MIWLAWRQLRTQALIVAGALAVLGVLLAVDGSHLLHLYDSSVLTCSRHNDCPSVTQNFEAQAKWNHVLSALVLVAPALIGVFWGAPLVAREFETRTNRLAWTQSVTRERWFAVKLAMVGAASVVSTGVLSSMVTWWASPYDRLQNVPYGVFDQRDIAPVAYALFAFVLGVFAGLSLRRTIPAMAVTLVAYIGARYAVSEWIKPWLITPLRVVTPFSLSLGQGTRPPGTSSVSPAAWVLSQQTLDRAGRIIGQNGGIGSTGGINLSPYGTRGMTFVGVGNCPNQFPAAIPVATAGTHQSGGLAASRAASRCVASFHLRSIVTYQPESRYWAFQWYEAAIFVGAAALLAGLSLWWLRHRAT